MLFPLGRRVRGQAGLGHPDRPVRAAPADRRADGLPREAAAALRRVHACARSPRGVGAPARTAHARRRVSRRGRTPSCCGTPRRVRVTEGASRRADARRGSRRSRVAPPPDRATWEAERERAFATRLAASVRRRDHAGSARRRACASRRSRAGEGRARPRAAAVEQGPLRHRDRAGRARGAADHRPRDRRRARRQPPPRRPRPKACSARKRRSPRSCGAALAQRDACGGRGATAFWRETYVAVPLEGMTLEGYVDLVYRERRAASSSSTTRPTRSVTTPTSPPHGPLPDPGRGVRPRDG